MHHFCCVGSCLASLSSSQAPSREHCTGFAWVIQPNKAGLVQSFLIVLHSSNSKLWTQLGTCFCSVVAWWVDWIFKLNVVSNVRRFILNPLRADWFALVQLKLCQQSRAAAFCSVGAWWVHWLVKLKFVFSMTNCILLSWPVRRKCAGFVNQLSEFWITHSQLGTLHREQRLFPSTPLFVNQPSKFWITHSQLGTLHREQKFFHQHNSSKFQIPSWEQCKESGLFLEWIKQANQRMNWRKNVWWLLRFSNSN